MVITEIATEYKALSSIAKKGLESPDVTKAIIRLSSASLKSLKKRKKLSIDSSIKDKEYFVYEAPKGKFSRPINANLFDETIFDRRIDIYKKFEWEKIGDEKLQKLIYTIAMSYCAAVDIVSRANKKSPSIFYEFLIGNIFAREYNTSPTTQIKIDLPEIKTTLPTDYLFQPANQFIRIHLPIKLSTTNVRYRHGHIKGSWKAYMELVHIVE